MQAWAELEQACLSCQKCALWETRTNVVFGDGSRDAKIMLIGEGPGATEDREGKPFVGRAGKLLDDMLAMIDLDREKVFISNIVKCRPPGNRDPLNAERDLCISWLEMQIKLLNPRIILCLGRIAAKAMIHEGFKISMEHGRWSERPDGIKVMAIYHPAALLRDPRRRPETFVDLKTLQKMIMQECPETYDLPVS